MTILDRFHLDDRVAVVTGAGRGIGAATAVALAEAGADVVLCSRTESQLTEVANQIFAVGRRAVVAPVDLTQPNAPANVVKTAVDWLGRLDIVVNNVGGAMPTDFMSTAAAEIEQAFRFNVGIAHELTQAAVPHLLKSPGASVVNISSAVGRVSGRGYLSYGTAKAALDHYTQLAAHDLAPNIRVNAIAPGAVATSALEVVLTHDEFRQQIEQATALRRIGDPQEIAATAVYLASDASSFMTGSILQVDGGTDRVSLELGFPDVAS